MEAKLIGCTVFRPLLPSRLIARSWLPGENDLGLYTSYKYVLVHNVCIHHHWWHKQHEMRSWPNSSPHDQQWESNPRPFDLESNVLSTQTHAPVCYIDKVRTDSATLIIYKLLFGTINSLCTTKILYFYIPLAHRVSSPVAQCVARRAPMQQCVWWLVRAPPTSS